MVGLRPPLLVGLRPLLLVGLRLPLLVGLRPLLAGVYRPMPGPVLIRPVLLRDVVDELAARNRRRDYRILWKVRVDFIAKERGLS